jgi:hypothetical protein
MARKLYTVKDIVELLNASLEKDGTEYRYTEQSVRARLRYLQSKGVDNRDTPTITPKVLNYDKRTKYYTEEDVEKLRNILIGPMLPEFTEYDEDLPLLEENDEIEVRPATISDIEAISHLSGLPKDKEQADIHDPVFRLVKEPNSKTFLAENSEKEIFGWSQAKISFGSSIVNGKLSGSIYIFIAKDKKGSKIALRSLIFRAHRWLKLRKAEMIVVEIPSSLADEENYLRSLDMTDTIFFSPKF